MTPTESGQSGAQVKPQQQCQNPLKSPGKSSDLRPGQECPHGAGKSWGVLREMVEMILARGGPSHTASVVRSVCQAAFMWNDTALWQRAVRACDADRAISELESENVLNAILEFGFDAVKPWYRHSLSFLLPRLMPL